MLLLLRGAKYAVLKMTVQTYIAILITEEQLWTLVLRNSFKFAVMDKCNTLMLEKKCEGVRCVQEPAACPYPEPDQTSPCPPSHFLKIHFHTIFPSTPGSSQWFFPSSFPTETLYTSLLSPYVLHALPI